MCSLNCSFNTLLLKRGLTALEKNMPGILSNLGLSVKWSSCYWFLEFSFLCRVALSFQHLRFYWQCKPSFFLHLEFLLHLEFMGCLGILAGPKTVEIIWNSNSPFSSSCLYSSARVLSNMKGNKCSTGSWIDLFLLFCTEISCLVLF